MHWGIYYISKLSNKVPIHKGAFKQFKHEHHFTELNSETLVTAILDDQSPFDNL